MNPNETKMTRTTGAHCADAGTGGFAMLLAHVVELAVSDYRYLKEKGYITSEGNTLKDWPRRNERRVAGGLVYRSDVRVPALQDYRGAKEVNALIDYLRNDLPVHLKVIGVKTDVKRIHQAIGL